MKWILVLQAIKGDSCDCERCGVLKLIPAHSRQPPLVPAHWLAVGVDCQDGPSQAPCRSATHCFLPKPRKTLRNYIALTLPLQREERDRGRVQVRLHGRTVNNSISSVPTAVRAGTAEKHFDCETDVVPDLPASMAREPSLQGNNGEGCRHDPAQRAGLPRPTVLSWVKSDMRVLRAKLPPPKRVGFLSAASQQPANTSVQISSISELA